MIPVKHQPATPLPWATDQHQTGIDIVNEETLFTVARAVGFGRNSVSPKMVIDNAAYIVHAANAYPKLVKALREISAVASVKVDDLLTLRKAQALLREIGEAS